MVMTPRPVVAINAGVSHTPAPGKAAGPQAVEMQDADEHLRGLHVDRIQAIDASEAMLAVASDKLSAQRDDGRITFSTGSVDDLPFDDATFDAVMVNQVLHHLGDGPDDGWRRHGRVVAELVRVLRPGGTLIANTCSRGQLQDGCWYSSLIPRAAALYRDCYEQAPTVESRTAYARLTGTQLLAGPALPVLLDAMEERTDVDVPALLEKVDAEVESMLHDDAARAP